MVWIKAWPHHLPPALPSEIAHSINGDKYRLRSFETGRLVRNLEAHLQERGVTLSSYKDKWGLPDDYPTFSLFEQQRRAHQAPWLERGPPATKSEIRASIGPDGIRSFEDGHVYQKLSRHIQARGLTPAEYRKKWGLPRDYPMTCAAEAARFLNIPRPGRKTSDRTHAKGTTWVGQLVAEMRAAARQSPD